ncbi:hypothetical protein HIM_01076 [Hirsutella minnesotensis 3608]|nr:hypothetical protein HIM_01076 [Hirsutella minnesotensis 3608]
MKVDLSVILLGAIAGNVLAAPLRVFTNNVTGMQSFQVPAEKDLSQMQSSELVQIIQRMKDEQELQKRQLTSVTQISPECKSQVQSILTNMIKSGAKRLRAFIAARKGAAALPKLP